MPVYSISAGPYTGELFGPEPPDTATLEQFAAIRDVLSDLDASKKAIVRWDCAVNGREMALAVKSFPRESWLRDRYFRKSGSKARRSFFTAVRLHKCGVGTPLPLAYIERWSGDRLHECYYLCAFEDGMTSFRDELYRLYRDDPLCRRIMTLMQTVAYSVADMHDAGVFHRDLGNQNIMLRRDGPDAWTEVQFIDLNRAQLVDNVSEKQRAREISRIDLPSDFLRVFKCMYHRDQHPAETFNDAEERFRRRFAFHTATRKYRHPLRTRRERASDTTPSGEAVPRGRDLWVWDDRSVQAVSTMRSPERHKYYPASNHFQIAKATLKSLLPVHRRYRDMLSRSFKHEVDLRGRIGLAVGTEPGQEDREAPLVSPLGGIPLLVRLYRHQDEAYNQAMLDYARRMKHAGHTICAALVQDRRAVRFPGEWKAFADRWIPGLQGVADWVEAGHAVNRVKWGLWNIDDYRHMLEPVVAAARAAGIKVCGPAVIDFEYHYLAALLDVIGGEGKLDALSGHLYVDRRGAPENRQGAFSAVEKFALAKAYAASSPAIKGDRYIVSEVNWPLLNTGHYSPVCSPYVIPFSHSNDPSVDEETYADYMIRYYTLALCSGHVDAVYWWRLAAHGFGLVDDHAEPWRPRPAYNALRTYTSLLGNSVFKEKIEMGEGVYAFRFAADGREHVLAWSHPRSARVETPFAFETMVGRDGEERSSTRDVSLGAGPVYFLGVR